MARTSPTSSLSYQEPGLWPNNRFTVLKWVSSLPIGEVLRHLILHYSFTKGTTPKANVTSALRKSNLPAWTPWMILISFLSQENLSVRLGNRTRANSANSANYTAMLHHLCLLMTYCFVVYIPLVDSLLNRHTTPSRPHDNVQSYIHRIEDTSTIHSTSLHKVDLHDISSRNRRCLHKL